MDARSAGYPALMIRIHALVALTTHGEIPE